MSDHNLYATHAHGFSVLDFGSSTRLDLQNIERDLTHNCQITESLVWIENNNVTIKLLKILDFNHAQILGSFLEQTSHIKWAD